MNNNWQEQFRSKFVDEDSNLREAIYPSDIIEFIRQREAEIRKETIEAVLPEITKCEECGGTDFSYGYEDGTCNNCNLDVFIGNIGFNNCLKEIKDKAKEKFNINLE